MELTVLAAAGATGLELTRQALARGHLVTAIARAPERIALPDSDRLIRVAADVTDPEGIAKALRGSEIVLSGLGGAGILTAGARAAVDAGRVVWLAALGTGESAAAAGWATRALLGLFMRAELPDRIAADTTVLRAGGTVFHAGPLFDGPISPTRRTVGIDGVPRQFFPARVSRATVAAAMLDEAETPRHTGRIAVPLAR
ncbi:NAD(P)-dependent oxidoreductase [Kutzneria sp. CA-103260]|uniref:NAD(P)-dependent oxidoreductase n=1 Tax=Kutzneria sp. CA-103260 TaxID=2802641 RepID=UPI001BA75595|nr:NAD(P)-binding oxidoreductase [Kutzneria sp. CA-103260]QUQ66977.1 NADH-flavin reductase [Kutzneria sp. CA-103260]